MKQMKLLALLLASFFVQAETNNAKGLTISKIRAVGNYESGTTYDNTVELWFSEPISWPETSGCTATYRVYINADNQHMISAAYLAFASGKKVNINANEALPIRNGSCELSYLDIIN